MEILDVAVDKHQQPRLGVFSSDEGASVFDLDSAAVVRRFGGLAGEVLNPRFARLAYLLF